VTPILSVLGAPAAFLVCTFFYLVGLSRILAMAPRPPESNPQGFWANFTGGLGYVYMRPIIRFTIMLAIFHCGLTMAFESLLPAFSRERLSLDDGGGTLIIGVGAGAFIASVFISGIQTNRARGNTLILTGMVSGLGQSVLSLTGVIWLAFPAAMFMGGAQAAFMTMTQAVTQATAADEFRGRVASINTFALGGMMATVNLLNGSLADQFGAHSLLFWEGLVFAGLVLLSLFAVTGRRVYGRAPALEPQLA
jgi:hypothetical protein